MPEGDTVFHTADTLRKALVGRTVTRSDIRVPQFATVDLAGHTVDEIVSRGKHLLIRVGPATVHSHMRMDGWWRMGTGPGRAGHKVRIVLEAGNVRALGIELGMLEVLDRARDHEAVAHLGPDLLGADWDPAVAAANLLAVPDRPLAQTLLDQRVLAGIGNVYCNEICFIIGRLPTAPVSSVTDPLRLMNRTHDMLWANRFRYNRITTGDTRGGRQMWVYGRPGQPCRRCGTPIRQDDTGDRIAYWCPSCQR